MSDWAAKDLRRRLAQGLTGWLTFEFQCGRGYLFSERYLAHAVGQLLRGRLSGEVYAEEPHRALKAKKRGHPPCVDFAVKGSDGFLLAVESKWIGRSSFHPKLLAWDCFRLESFARNEGCRAFMILGGLRKEILAFYAHGEASVARPRGGTAPLLPNKVGVLGHVVHASYCGPETVKHLAAKREGATAGAIAESFRCSAVQLDEVEANLGFAVAVWEITSA